MVCVMQPSDVLEVQRQRFHDPQRHRGAPILLPFSPSDHDLPPFAIEVLDPKVQAFLPAQAGPVQERRDEEGHARQLCQDAPDFVPAQNNWHTLRRRRPRDVLDLPKVDVQHVPAEEEDAAQRLVLG